MGPNQKKLIIRKMAIDAIPNGSGLSAGIAFLSSKDNVMDGFRTAAKWVDDAISVVKSAPDNTFGDDESIAGEILKRIESKGK